MTQYAILPTRRPDHEAHGEPDHPHALSYFIVVELGREPIEDEGASSPIVMGASWTYTQDEEVRRCHHAEPEDAPNFADTLPRADVIHLYG